MGSQLVPLRPPPSVQLCLTLAETNHEKLTFLTRPPFGGDKMELFRKPAKLFNAGGDTAPPNGLPPTAILAGPASSLLVVCSFMLFPTAKLLAAVKKLERERRACISDRFCDCPGPLPRCNGKMRPEEFCSLPNEREPSFGERIGCFPLENP